MINILNESIHFRRVIFSFMFDPILTLPEDTGSPSALRLRQFTLPPAHPHPPVPPAAGSQSQLDYFIELYWSDFSITESTWDNKHDIAVHSFICVRTS